MTDRLKSTKKNCILVLGMHRSGTSAISKLISFLGATLPKITIPANDGNTKGHWEPANIVETNDHLLSALNHSWDEWSSIDFDRLPIHEKYLFKSKICQQLQSEYEDANVFVLKDPRICRLFPIYLEILQELNIDIKIVLPFRNPTEVASSLHKRDGIGLHSGHLYWLRHLLEAEKLTRDIPRVFVSFNDLLADWHEVARKLCDEWSDVLKFPSENQILEVEEFIDTEMQHFASGRIKLANQSQLVGWLVGTLNSYEALASSPTDDNILSTLDEIGVEFETASKVFDTVFQEKQDELVKLETELSEVQNTILQRDLQLAELETQKNQQISELETQKETQLAELETQKNQQISELETQIKVQLSELEKNLNDEISERDQTIRSITSDIEIAEQALKVKTSELDEISTLFNEQVSSQEIQLTDLKEECDRFSNELLNKTEELENANQSLKQIYDQRLSEENTIQNLSNQLERAEHVSEALKSSTSWKVSKPVRAMGKCSNLPREIIDKKIIEDSTMFDPEWYRHTYPDVASTKLNPLIHYIRFGCHEGRNPFQAFNTEWYLQQNPDLVKSKMNPLAHYIKYGAREGRMPNPQYQRVVIASVSENKKNVLKNSNDIKKKLSKLVRPNALTEIEARTAHLKKFIEYDKQNISAPLGQVNSDRMDIVWIIPDFLPGAGGHMTIFRIARYLSDFGHNVTFYIQNPSVHKNGKDALETIKEHFQPFNGKVHLLSTPLPILKGDAIIATDRFTCYPVDALGGFRKKFYFVQDYETIFYPMGGEALLSEATYHMGFDCLCAGDWLSNMMQNKYGLWAASWPLAYDSTIYKTSGQTRSDNRIAFYARYETPRRAVELGFLALEILHKRNVSFEVDFFGTNLGDLQVEYPHVSHGLLTGDQLADLYQKSTIGMVYSATNHSLANKEMMACGLPVVDLDVESVREIFPEDTLVRATPTPEGIADALEKLLAAPAQQSSLRNNGFEFIKDISWEKSARIVEKAILGRLD